MFKINFSLFILLTIFSYIMQLSIFSLHEMTEIEETNVHLPPDQVFCNLKLLKISGFNGYPNEISLVEFFLTSAIALESLVLVAPAPSIIASLVTPVSSTIESLLLLPKAAYFALWIRRRWCNFALAHTRALYEICLFCMISATLSYGFLFIILKVLIRCVTTIAVCHLQPHFSLSSESRLCLEKKVKVDC